MGCDADQLTICACLERIADFFLNLLDCDEGANRRMRMNEGKGSPFDACSLCCGGENIYISLHLHL